MMSSVIEALHIIDGNRPILTHEFASRPLSANQLLPLYTAYAEPRPNLIYLPNTNPPTLIFSLIHSNLTFLITTSGEIEPLLVFEFLHRVVDVLEEFIGSPLLAPKIENNYHVVAQLLNEMCDSGCISTTEPNALRDLVEVEGWIGKLLGNISIPGKPGFPTTSNTNTAGSLSLRPSPLTSSALPWRRANVRHTSNEVYVDIIETLSVTIAPSGRPIAAFVNGSIFVTSKISGVPDLQLILSVPSGKQSINSVIESPVFHPCVRLSEWKENPGEINFIPPDGKFVLAGYGVDLLPIQNLKIDKSNPGLKLPLHVEVKTGIGPTCSEFEVRLIINKVSSQGNSSTPASSSRGTLAGGRIPSGIGKNSATSSESSLQDLVVTIPLPKDLRNLSEIRASRGETIYSPGARSLQWEIPSKELSTGSAMLRCIVANQLSDDDNDFKNSNIEIDNIYSYQEDAYRTSNVDTISSETETIEKQQSDLLRLSRNKALMPTSAVVSFSVKGWLASGIKVEKINIDTKKSRGLSNSVRPYKGVKYLTICRDGIDIRC